MSEIALYLGALLVLGVMGVTWAVRLAHHAPAPATAAVTAPEPGTRRAACHTTRCAHLDRLHRLQPNGLWMCADCGTSKAGDDL